MPIVSAAHRATQRVRILEAAERCFARNGIHPTTMQDVCREAALSPGAVYGYFAGKQQIVRAVFRRSLADNVRWISSVAATVGPEKALAAALARGFATLDDRRTAASMRFGVIAAGEAMRDRSLARVQATLYRDLVAQLRPVVTAARRAGALPPTPGPDVVIRLLIALFEGFRCQKLVTPSLRAVTFGRSAAALLLGRPPRGARP